MRFLLHRPSVHTSAQQGKELVIKLTSSLLQNLHEAVRISMQRLTQRTFALKSTLCPGNHVLNWQQGGIAFGTFLPLIKNA